MKTKKKFSPTEETPQLSTCEGAHEVSQEELRLGEHRVYMEVQVLACLLSPRSFALPQVALPCLWIISLEEGPSNLSLQSRDTY